MNQLERRPDDGWPIILFENPHAFEVWLERHYADQDGLWVKLAKKDSGIASLSFAETLEVAMCFGWIDSKRHRYDDDYYLQRYSPRRPRSNWSERNKRLAERLIAEGRMRPAGLEKVKAVRLGGQWPLVKGSDWMIPGYAPLSMYM